MGKEISEIDNVKECTTNIDAVRINEVTDEYIELYFGSFQKADQVVVHAKLRFKPKIMYPLILKIIQSAELYEEQTAKKLFPENFIKKSKPSVNKDKKPEEA